MKQKEKLLIVTNLYPLPWQPNRATFNFQQFENLKAEFDIAIIVPVAWPEFFKNRHLIDDAAKTEVKFVPCFYIPKLGRRFNGVFMYHSIMATSKQWIEDFPPTSC